MGWGMVEGLGFFGGVGVKVSSLGLRVWAVGRRSAWSMGLGSRGVWV